MSHKAVDARIMHVATVALLVVMQRTSLAAQASQPPRPTFVAPDWVFARSTLPATIDDSVTRHSVPRSSVSATQAQAHDRHDVVDWHPGTHPPMPAVVKRGRPRSLDACAYCHLPNGLGRPENAMLAGLPADYMIRQVNDMKAGRRQVRDVMMRVADSVSAEELRIAARYFARLAPSKRSKVVEATQIARPIAAGGLYFADTTQREPLGRRLIEIATDAERHELHDSRAEYIAYVPPGSIARGRTLATVGRGATKSCTSCHGPNLRGVAPAPPIAGRAASYILRQLVSFRTGVRSTAAGAPMREVVETLDLDDMIAVAAYVATRQP